MSDNYYSNPPEYRSPSEAWVDSMPDNVNQYYTELSLRNVEAGYRLTSRWRIIRRHRYRQHIAEIKARRERLVNRSAQKLQDALKPKARMTEVDPFEVIRARTDDPEILAALERIKE